MPKYDKGSREILMIRIRDITGAHNEKKGLGYLNVPKK